MKLNWKSFVTAAAPPKLVQVPQAAPEPPKNPFVVGDYIRLMPNTNPYKGTLKCGKIYPVLGVINQHIMLRGDNSTTSYFRFHQFELAPPPPVTAAGADEYDEAMRAEQLMEEGKPS